MPIQVQGKSDAKQPLAIRDTGGNGTRLLSALRCKRLVIKDTCGWQVIQYILSMQRMS